MRPLTLTVSGLRSYRSREYIDFTGKELVAVVGDTGAGKSSLLEAICYALYGSSTWHGNKPSALIADGGDGTARVELTFVARGQTWQITRSTSRGNYPPSIHRLKCMDDGTEIDGEGPVKAAIRRLVGLDYDTFLKAVILPQGRFQELLQASEGGRTRILKSILGLDQIIAVKDRAVAMHGRLRPQLTALQIQHAALLPDPAAVIKDARAQLAAAEKRIAHLNAARQVIRAAEQSRRAASTKAGQLRDTADQLATLLVDNADHRYQELIQRDGRATADLTAIGVELATVEKQEHDLQEVLAAADADGTGVSVVAGVIGAVDGLVRRLADLDDEQRRLSDEKAQVAADRDAVLSRRATVPVVDGRAHDAETQAATAEQKADTAAEQVRAARLALAAARQAVGQVSDGQQAVRDAQALAGKRQDAAAEAQRLAAAAERDYQNATEELRRLERANAAAHVASGCKPGQPCPVCAHPLPDNFDPPKHEGTEAATDAEKAAEKRAKTLGKKATAAETLAATANADIVKAQQALTGLEHTRDQRLAELCTAVGAVDLAEPDDALLAGLLAVKTERDQQRDKAREQARSLRDQATAAATELKLAEAALTGRQAAFSKAERAAAGRRTQLLADAARLPEKYRVDAELTADALLARKAEAEQRRGELAVITQQLARLQPQANSLRHRRQGIQDRHRTDVDQPASQLRRSIQRLADRAAEAADALALPGPPAAPDAGLPGERSWAAAVAETASNFIDCYRRQADDQDTVAITAERQTQQARSHCGVTTDDELETAARAAAENAGVARDRLTVATEQLPVKAEIERRLAVAGPAVDSLEEVARLLADGKFMTAVVHRKQRALLGTATTLLLSLTDRRYAFADNFRILDSDTGQPRDVKTLSGGETFLASLALALALVELASRTGARVEALFLDEGFGSLDRNVLTEALETLGRQTTGRRLVVLISHMRAIAENIEHVLVVEKTLTGSQAHWASANERDQIITDDLAAGLLP